MRVAIFDSNEVRASGTSFADMPTLKIAGKNDVGVGDENPNCLYFTKGDCATPRHRTNKLSLSQAHGSQHRR